MRPVSTMSSIIITLLFSIFSFDIDKFKDKYIKETENYYLDLAKDTLFQEDINNALEILRGSYENRKTI